MALSDVLLRGTKRISGVRGSLFGLAVVGFGLALGSAAHAQDRRIVTIEDADFFGSDYRTVKDVDLDGCKAVCLSDNQCRAFTFNTSAGWCFLKSDFGQLQSFRGAIAGRVVEVAQPRQTAEVDRKAELSFIDKDLIEGAATYSKRIEQDAKPRGQTAENLRQAGQTALNAKNGVQAEQDFSAVIALLPDDYSAWSRLTFALLLQNPKDWQERRTKQENATSAAINTYLRAVTEDERVWGLNLLGTSLSRRDMWKPAIKSLRAALALDNNSRLRKRYDDMVAKHGFRIVDHQVDADGAAPRICVILSDKLPKDADLSPYVSVIGDGTTTIETERSQICVDGVQHGSRYSVTLRSGLPAADGEKLERPANLSVYVRDRSPTVHFLGRAYVLPAGGDPTIPIVSVNTSEVEAKIYRIGDRGLVSAIRDERFLRQLNSYRSDQISDEQGEEVWSGIVETENRLNEDITTAIPLNDIGLDMKPGVYAMTARSKLDNQNRWGDLATQWFIVSDLGLTAYSGDDGVTANIRSLASAKALSGIKVQLLAVNNEILGNAVSDDQGFARFEAGLTRGAGGMAPGLLVAETDDGDYSFLDLRKPAFDLSDRGVEGRPAPGPLDVFAWTDRGIYKAGETVHAQAMIRTAKAVAQDGLPLTFVIDRPDGVEQSRHVVEDTGLGGHLLDIDLSQTAQQGVWSWRIYVDPKGTPLASNTFLVEDYQPERVDFELKTAAEAFDPAQPTEIELSARYLYGSPASDQGLEGDIIVSPTRSQGKYPGYQFGLADSETYPQRDYIKSDQKTDLDGNLSFTVSLPELPETTALYKGELVARLVEAGGRYVERRLELPVRAESGHIGVKPMFDSGVDEGGPADFSVIAIDRDGNRQNAEGLVWTLSKINRRYQWYRSDGRWSYEPITTTERVANGKLDVTTDKPASLSLPVTWGQYRLEVASAGAGEMVTSVEFSAGWYTADATSETPDYLDVGLDKKSYRPGETAILRMKPQSDGLAVVNVVSGGLLSSQVVTVTAGEAEVSLPVTEEWGAGAYVTASLYRPMDVAQKRMPSRAIGLSWLQMEPGDRDLAVTLSAPDTMRPGTRLEVPVKLASLKPGTEAYLTVAAVDLGILNLTGFKTPEPETWYFGQRKLGTEIRDLYGQLIDRMAGTRGKVRSGGDAMASRLQAPPPDEEPVALFSGLVKVDDNGEATVSFDVPEFNGTLRLMAVAWSRDGVGHGEQDVAVRSPVVVTASLPGFLAPGDSSRLLLNIDNVEGAAGDYDLLVSAEGPVALEAGEAALRQVSLGEKAKAQVILPIRAASGAGTAQVFATLTAPDGSETIKRVGIDVKDTQPDVVRRSVFALAGGGSLLLDANSFEGLKPETVTIKVSSGGAAQIDVAGLLEALDRYPYGCTEQTTSRALPLLYLNEVAHAAGLGESAEIRQRVVGAIRRVLANQSSSGSFGLWSSYGSSDTWLDAYVTDFLTRAREQGYLVPAIAFENALDNLENRLAYASDVTDGGMDIAYALYVLARNGRASMGDLRYYLDAKLASFTTPLAKAQVAASLALYGEQERAATGFKAAVAGLQSDGLSGYRSDYGSRLRDGAGVLTYIVASSVDTGEKAQVTDLLRRYQDQTRHYSTQDMAWLLMAARELNKSASADKIAVDGVVEPNRLVWPFDGEAVGQTPVRLENQGSDATDLLVSVTGQPRVPEPAGGHDYAIERQIYDLDGNPVDPNAVPVNTRLAVVLTVRALSDVRGRLMVVDRIPAGLAIDNPRLVRSGDLGGLDFLSTINETEHAAFHEDRFEVAVDQTRHGDKELTFAYLARAVTPGSYAHPPASVEDMYRPGRRAITDTSTFTVLGPTR
jgi:uncharacterized protein YfaS (alpha-2-macroglobulin family)